MRCMPVDLSRESAVFPSDEELKIYIHTVYGSVCPTEPLFGCSLQVCNLLIEVDIRNL